MTLSMSMSMCPLIARLQAVRIKLSHFVSLGPFLLEW